MNDRERQMWVDNDEGLYDMWKRSGLSQRQFIRENRATLDSAINSVLNQEPEKKDWRYDCGV
jgi:hypothetical protein